MANKIANIIYSLIFVMPLLFSVLCLFKVVLVDWSCKKKDLSYIAKFFILAPFTTTALFLMCFIIIRFIFPDVNIPYFFNVIGIVLFFLYFGVFFGLLYGIGTLGHGGIAPGAVVQELYKLFKKTNSL